MNFTFLQGILVIVARLLQTSMASAVADGDPEATATGYLFLCAGFSHKGDEGEYIHLFNQLKCAAML